MSNNFEHRTPKIGDIYLMNFKGQGSEQKGWRPGLVFQNNLANKHSPNIIALPLTSSIKRVDLPTHVLIPSEGTGLERDSIVLCENPERISKDRLGVYLTSITNEHMRNVAIANLLASSAISYVEPEVLYSIWEKASSLNTIE